MRTGALIVFKPGMTAEDAEAILGNIASVIDFDYYVGNSDEEKLSNMVHTYDPEWGGPVWYLP